MYTIMLQCVPVNSLIPWQLQKSLLGTCSLSCFRQIDIHKIDILLNWEP